MFEIHKGGTHLKHEHANNNDAHIQDERRSSTRMSGERFFASFATHRIDVPYVEVTVVARSRQQAKQIARELVAPLGLSHPEID